MTILTIIFALTLLCPYAVAQAWQANVPQDKQVLHHQIVNRNMSEWGDHEILGMPSHSGPETEFTRRIDSFQMKASRYQFLNEKITQKGVKKSSGHAPGMLLPRSQIYVIDTAVVRSTFGTSRHLYSFNDKAKRTSDVVQTLSGGSWMDRERETNTYDARGNMLTDVYESRSQGQWMIQWRYTYTYDEGNNILTEVYEYWLDGQLSYQWRYTYTYDANNNMLTNLNEYWLQGQWANDSRRTYTYDAHNKISDLYESWSNGQWMSIQRHTYTFDARNNQLTDLDEGWTDGQWVISGRSTHSYDASNNMLTELDEYWSNDQWVNSLRHTYTYDANNNMLTAVHESWPNFRWVYEWRDTHIYDSGSNMLTSLYEYWSNDQWVNGFRYEYTYNPEGYLNSAWHYIWTDSLWMPSDGGRGSSWSTNLVLADGAGNQYAYSGWYHIDLSYKINITGIASQGGNMPAVYFLSQNYPNPFNPTTTIMYELPRTMYMSLTVYDVLGREVSVLVNDRREAGVHEVKFDGSSLASGVYFYRIQAGTYVQSRKLSLLR